MDQSTSEILTRSNLKKKVKSKHKSIFFVQCGGHSHTSMLILVDVCMGLHHDDAVRATQSGMYTD